MASEMVRLAAAPTAEYYETDDPRWHDELADLDREIRRQVGRDAVLTEPAEGDKGIELLSVIVALGSAGAFTAIVEAFGTWLGRRPKRRSLDITWTAGDRSGAIHLDGENLDADAITAALSAVQEAVREGP